MRSAGGKPIRSGLPNTGRELSREEEMVSETDIIQIDELSRSTSRPPVDRGRCHELDPNSHSRYSMWNEGHGIQRLHEFITTTPMHRVTGGAMWYQEISTNPQLQNFWV